MKKRWILVLAITAVPAGWFAGSMYAEDGEESETRLEFDSVECLSAQENTDLQVMIGLLEDLRLNETIYHQPGGMSTQDSIDLAVQTITDVDAEITLRRYTSALSARLVHLGVLTNQQDEALAAVLVEVMQDTEDNPAIRVACRKVAEEYQLQQFPGIEGAIGFVDSDAQVEAWKAMVVNRSSAQP